MSIDLFKGFCIVRDSYQYLYCAERCTCKYYCQSKHRMKSIILTGNHSFLMPRYSTKIKVSLVSLSLSLSTLPIPFTSITNAFIRSRPINKVRALHSFAFCASSPLQDLLILLPFFPSMVSEKGYLYSFTAHLIYFHATVSAFPCLKRY